jgi:hypothetical protein
MDHAIRTVLARGQRRRRPVRGSRVPAAAGRPGPGRCGGHRRRAADPRRGGRGPRGQAGPLPVGRQGQPAHAAGPLRPPGLASRPGPGPPRDRGHGRLQLRTLKAVTVHHFGFPHAAQVIQVTRKIRQPQTRRWRTVTVDAITSLPSPGQPARLADLIPGGTGRSSTACIMSATPPSPRTPRSAPAPARTSWPACATWPSARSAGRATSPPPCATTPATRADPWPPSASPWEEPGATKHPGALALALGCGLGSRSAGGSAVVVAAAGRVGAAGAPSRVGGLIAANSPRSPGPEVDRCRR